ncbi:MAG: hypothetical protein IKM07_00770 [Clostridia bacterium]|nr:hypothetical protein [Clostridia bacterium]
MIRTVKRDPWFDKQPPLSFIEDLKTPVHMAPPADFGKRAVASGEVCVKGLWIDNQFPDPNGLLVTVIEDFDRFACICGIEGESFCIRIVEGETPCFEAYSISVSKSGITITAADTEGVRRALIWLEDEMRRREGPYLPLGKIDRKPSMTARITRCFFSPINRPPKYGDELSDDIDYYPEEYLNRIMHDGSNGVWIYTRFSDLVHSSYIKEFGQGSEARIEKLNRVIAKCARYGVRVYVFAIEPMSLEEELAKKYSDYVGAELYGHRHTFCMDTEFGQAYCEEAGRKLFELCPDLGGFISITFGERGTSCASAYRKNPDGKGSIVGCPRCAGKAPGVVLGQAVDALTSGMRKAKPEADLISWTYGQRLWNHDDIREYIRNLPEGVIAQQNFDDMGYEEQLGRERMAVDYWMSYVGPSELFKITAEEAQKCSKPMFAKMQVCCSHEIASVPYIPTPGIIFKKFAAAHALGVTGVMECWYFGNYPSLMSKAAGELAFENDFSDEEDFLKRLAGIYWGNSKAAAVVRAWQLFEKGYRQYPINVMFSYYGPMHDGPVWKLWLKPKNFSLPRSWQSLDPIDGDRIGESLMNGHTLEEALTLAGRMSRFWNAGLRELDMLEISDEAKREQWSVAHAVGLLFESGRNILEFYHLRDQLGHGIKPAENLDSMRTIVEAEIRQSKALALMCVQDGRLGYHSEAEGYKFFPEKLEERIAHLEMILATEFVEVQERIDKGLAPLAYYLGEEEGIPHYKMGRDGIENADWELMSDGKTAFRVAYDDEDIAIEFKSERVCGLTLCPEFALMWPDASLVAKPDGSIALLHDHFMYYQLYGERAAKNLGRWTCKVMSDKGTHLLFTVKRADTDWDGVTPMKLKLASELLEVSGKAGHVYEATDEPMVLWSVEADPVITLGKSSVSPGQYGWLMP